MSTRISRLFVTFIAVAALLAAFSAAPTAASGQLTITAVRSCDDNWVDIDFGDDAPGIGKYSWHNPSQPDAIVSGQFSPAEGYHNPVGPGYTIVVFEWPGQDQFTLDLSVCGQVVTSVVGSPAPDPETPGGGDVGTDELVDQLVAILIRILNEILANT